MSESFWAIKNSKHGFYTGTWLKRIDAIAAHVHGRYRWTESSRPKLDGALFPMQREDWTRARKDGDTAVRVKLTEVPALSSKTPGME